MNRNGRERIYNGITNISDDIIERAQEAAGRKKFRRGCGAVLLRRAFALWQPARCTVQLSLGCSTHRKSTAA